jgi:hypothetical protein
MPSLLRQGYRIAAIRLQWTMVADQARTAGSPTLASTYLSPVVRAAKARRHPNVAPDQL